ncbi:AsmA family protein [uncultured Sphingomonas sp.]|uniref:AsmA family protein n=1 Tax=uncultured Sphingomonas sp. TaxID=158754 RepID=UPI0035CC07A0
MTVQTEIKADEHRPRERRAWRIVRNVVLGVLGAVFAVWLVLYITKGRFLRGPFETIVGRQIKREVTVAGDFQLYFDPFDIKFLAERMRIANPAWATRPDLFAAQRIETRIPPLSLLWGRRRARFLDLVGGRIDLEWDAAHRRNTWTFSENKGEPFEMPLIGRATVAGTSLRYLDPRLRVLVDVGFETIRAGAGRIDDQVRFSGTGRALDSPFTLAGSLLSPNSTVTNGENKLQATARFGRDVVEMSGTLPSATQIEGVPLRVAARGRNMAELLGIIGVTVPESRGYRVRARMVKEGSEYRFTRLTGRFGTSDIAGRFTVKQREPRIHIDADLTTRSLDIVDVAPFMGYNPDLIATVGVAAASGQAGPVPRLLPDARLRVESLKLFDADVRYKVAAVRSRRVPISNIDLTLTLANRLLTMSPLTFSMARGEVASDIVIDARGTPVRTKYDIRLAPTPIARLLAGWGVEEAGTSGTVRARAQLVGVGDTVHDSLSTANGRIAITIPAGTMWTRNAQLSELDLGTFALKMFQDKLKEPIRIRCGLIGFTVRNGVAAADPILIDTSKNVVVGRGGFSFRTEAIDLAFRADGKKFSIFSGQSPVGVGGQFAAPKLDVISPELLARAGAGLGLALVASPVGAVLAFVDIGDAKSAACGPVLGGATAAAQRTTRGEKRDDVGRGTTSKEENSGPKRKKFLGIF